MKKLFLLIFVVSLFSCGNKLKDTVWACTVIDNYMNEKTYKIEFLTGDKCSIEPLTGVLLILLTVRNK